MQQHKNVPLSVDITKVAGIPFLMATPNHIPFGIGTYVTRGFALTIMLADNPFEPMRGNFADLHAQFHITA